MSEYSSKLNILIKFLYLFSVIIFVFTITGCGGMTAIVLDVQTRQPIEGVVIVTEWKKSVESNGRKSLERYKMIEVITDKEGKAFIKGVSDHSVEEPSMTVFKSGYVAWNSEKIFPDNKKRTDFKWADTYIFELEKFNPNYDYETHLFFLLNHAIFRSSTDLPLFNTPAYPMLFKAVEEDRKSRGRLPQIYQSTKSIKEHNKIKVYSKDPDNLHSTGQANY